MHQIFNAHHRPGDFDIQESTTVAQFNKMRAFKFQKIIFFLYNGGISNRPVGNDSNLLIVFYVQIVPDDFVMQLHRF